MYLEYTYGLAPCLEVVGRTSDGWPWDHALNQAFAPLRAAPAAADTERGQSAATTDLVSATVAFRLICANVTAGGALWLKGKPSPTGRTLLKQLLPESSFFSEFTASGTVFVAAYPRCTRQKWYGPIVRLCAVEARGFSPAGSRFARVLSTIPGRWTVCEPRGSTGSSFILFCFSRLTARHNGSRSGSDRITMK